MRDSFDAVILANGEYPSASTPLHILHSASYVVCCDGGADRYIELGYTPDAIIGDGDSLSDQNRIRFANIIHYNPDQDTNDQTKAVEFLQEKGIKNIAIVGATGKCEDHTIGNIALLVEYMRMGIDVCSFTDYGVFVPYRNDSSFECQAGQKVSSINISAKNLSCKGLEYPIYDFTAWWQGTLNRCTGSEFSIHAEGEYIVFINYL